METFTHSLIRNFYFNTDEWTHIAVTYDSSKEIAVIYVNGEIKEGANGAGALSEDWDGRASFGYHEGIPNSFDYFDEIYMFDRELSPLEVRQMFMKCSDVLPYGKDIFRPESWVSPYEVPTSLRDFTGYTLFFIRK